MILNPDGTWTAPDGRTLRPIAGGYDGGVTAYILLAATIASAAVSAYGTYEAGQAQKEASRFNAEMAEREASERQRAADRAARQQAEQDRMVRARARALYGAAGVDVGEGSPLLVDAYSARQSAENVAEIRRTGQVQASALQAQGMLDRFMGQQAGRAGTIGAFSSLLGGVASGVSGYYGTRRPRSQTWGYM